MDNRSLFSGLQYRGRVRSVRRDYHVLEGAHHYVVLSPKDDVGGYYTIVHRAALSYIVKRLGGTKSITTAEAFEACKRSKYLTNRFSVLNALYALVGTKEARISKVVGHKLFFGIRKRTV
jgi:hypothetical protein